MFFCLSRFPHHYERQYMAVYGFFNSLQFGLCFSINGLFVLCLFFIISNFTFFTFCQQQRLWVRCVTHVLSTSIMASVLCITLLIYNTFIKFYKLKKKKINGKRIRTLFQMHLYFLTNTKLAHTFTGINFQKLGKKSESNKCTTTEFLFYIDKNLCVTFKCGVKYYLQYVP